MRFVLAGILLFAGQGLVQAQQLPGVPEGGLLSVVSADSILGTGFLLETEHCDPVALTAYHVLQNAGIPAEVILDTPSLAVRPIGRTGVEASAPVVGRVPVAGAHAMSPRDFAIMEVRGNTRDVSLALSSRAAAVGDTVWLYARLINPSAPSNLLHAANVVVRDSMLYFVLRDPGFIPSDSVIEAQIAASPTDSVGVPTLSRWAAKLTFMGKTSGAPVVDRYGAVVGLHVGAADVSGLLDYEPGCCAGWDSELLVGVAVPAAEIRVALDAAVGSTGCAHQR